MPTEFLCISVLRVASGPRLKFASCKSALNLPVVCSTDRSKAVVPVLVLLFVTLWFILRNGSNEYPQSVFLSRNKKKTNNVHPCKSQFCCIKVRFKEVKTI